MTDPDAKFRKRQPTDEMCRLFHGAGCARDGQCGVQSKLRLRLDDPHVREVWETILRAGDEVAAWPAWKRGR